MPKRKNRKAETSKLRKITPTLKQTIAFKKLVEIGRNSRGRKGITIGKVLKEAGYSLAVQLAPTKVTKSKGFAVLLEKYLPDELITRRHNEAFDAKKIDHYVFPLSVSDEEIRELVAGFGFKVTKIQISDSWKRAYFSTPDHFIRMSAIKEGYKIKNKYEPEEHIITNKLTDELLERIIKD